MKYIKVFICLIICSFCFNVKAITNPYVEKNSYDTNSSWYVWQKVKEKTNIELPKWGNPSNWLNDAKSDGYSIGKEPKANSIVVWGAWASGDEGGHVGYVEKVEDEKIYVWEPSVPCFDTTNDVLFNECLDSGEDTNVCFSKTPKIACSFSTDPEEFGTLGYIYLNDAPKKTNTNTDKPKEEVTKSSNAYLSSITLSNGDIQFKKDTFEYSLEVAYEVDKIEVSATLEDSKSTLNGVGEYELNVGENEIKLSVTAEDKTKKEYKINITRKEEVKEKEEQVEDVKEDAEIIKKGNDKAIIIVIASSVLVVLGVSLVVIKKLKVK